MDDPYDYMLEQFNNTFKTINNCCIYYIQYNQPNIIKYLRHNNINAIILSGSRKRILEENSPTLPHKIIKLGIPILALCYGFEWIAKLVGGNVATFKDKKLHKYNKFLKFEQPFKVPPKKYAFNHHDYINDLPNGWDKLIIYDDQIWVAYNKQSKILGLQFHPEVNKSSNIAFYSQWIAWLKENI
jgi:GMP synthase-like glutamine amidotransferase